MLVLLCGQVEARVYMCMRARVGRVCRLSHGAYSLARRHLLAAPWASSAVPYSSINASNSLRYPIASFIR